MAYVGRVVSENESENHLCPGGICYDITLIHWYENEMYKYCEVCLLIENPLETMCGINEDARRYKNINIR